MKLNLVITALTAVLAIGSACQTPAEARYRYEVRQAQYNSHDHNRQQCGHKNSGYRNRYNQHGHRHGNNGRYGDYNNRDDHHGHHNR